jgi:hypothetical protein
LNRQKRIGKGTKRAREREKRMGVERRHDDRQRKKRDRERYV